MATHSSILPWRIPMDRGAWWATVPGVPKGETRMNRLSTHAQCVTEKKNKQPKIRELGFTQWTF